MIDFIIDNIVSYVNAVAAIVIAIATVSLMSVTKVLAVETKRMADLSAQPQIVASIIPNQWSLMHIDIEVENTGNATAFDIALNFDPALPRDSELDAQTGTPLQKISILKPGQKIGSFIGSFRGFENKSFDVTVSWKRSPTDDAAETLNYTICMSDYNNLASVGSREPIIQIAEQIKNIREDWRPVSTGNRKVKADTFSNDDRVREKELLAAQFEEIKKKS